ncbi:MAG: NnrS family protein [Gammaproteobacteria bacterium]|nr:NnrS family protein [Gammaproteobacteria bacterium]
MLNIDEQKPYRISFLHLGFRPFFMMAGLFSCISVIFWAWLYHQGTDLPAIKLSPAQWHSHEMVFGFGFAVIAGFLLTAVKNWTGVQTTNGWRLLILAAAWAAARIMPALPVSNALILMAFLDIGFDLLLVAAVFRPIARVRQWKQLGIWACLIVLTGANFWFYLATITNHGTSRDAVTLGLYTIILLITLMGRRVIPFFIEKGLYNPASPAPVLVKNWRWVDITNLILMPLHGILMVMGDYVEISMTTAGLLAVTHGTRLFGWYAHGIHKTPMLWVLYVGYSWIPAGFSLHALSVWLDPNLGLHALSYGAIGMITLGMMARVALGHTGRDIYESRPLLTLAFSLLLIGAITRSLLPAILSGQYLLLIGISQALWITAFAIFSAMYMPILIKPRVDGRHG